MLLIDSSVGLLTVLPDWNTFLKNDWVTSEGIYSLLALQLPFQSINLHSSRGSFLYKLAHFLLLLCANSFFSFAFAISR